jgi:peptidoglycan hydrolase-like amidase
VKLRFFEKPFADISANANIEVWNKSQHLGTISVGNNLKILPQEKNFIVQSNQGRWEADTISLKTKGALEIKNYNRGLGRVPYNKFRNQLNFHLTKDKKLLIVNELPIEDYLWGLAEEPSTEPNEKKHTIHILARSYALVYSGTKRKFKTTLYDLEDDPKSSQFYLGYDWERYHPDQKKLLAQTAGQVITYAGRPAIGPYFTQSGGESSAAWQRQYPWTKAQKLPFDEGLTPKGHGIGLSGNTARELAKKGWDSGKILKFFFDDIKIEKKY